MSEKTGPSLGKNMRRLRTERGWSMVKMGDVVGLTQSSLSKIENDLMSLSYEKLVEVSRKLDCDISELFRDDEQFGRNMAASARIAVDRNNDRKLVQWRNIRHRQLAVEVKDRLMIPTYGEVTGDGQEPTLELGDYFGERFIYVLEGNVTFHSEFYEAYKLKAGDSIYLDIRMRHTMTTPKGKTARVLVITTSEDKKFLAMERALAAQGLTNIAEFEQFQRPASRKRPE
ncbi:helix-turn-helix domain-containing protein [Sphingomonas canadensis]|uniref:Helix-turn-helix domain-containing protein n=1 Tax=Sphingomonas canadensis TaxID=1219257 RepID=A0ABW3HAC3_9SPHN|nr:XRE family transcriptional regulator [Sphingomonas canadensis]MCW3836960.1 XRE family transcriptional regulator [Sphingomonas canadensis]